MSLDLQTNISLSELKGVFKYEDTMGRILIKQNKYKFKKASTDNYFNEVIYFYFKDIENNVFRLSKPVYSREVEDDYILIGTLIEEADVLLMGIN